MDESGSAFADRHIGPTPTDQATMLAGLGFASLTELTDAAIPASIRATTPLVLPDPVDEAEIGRRLRELAARNNPGRAMIGEGYYGTRTPAVIRRGVLGDPSWYTAYTPYQSEISQGRLEALLVFQTMIADLTGLDAAGAGLLDEATALAEAVAMAKRCAPRTSGRRVLVDARLFPASLAVLRTRARRLGLDVVTCEVAALADADLTDAFAVVVQTPDRDGRLAATAELAGIAERAHQAGARVVAAADLLALTLVTPPGEWGADIAVGSTQRFGVPLFYGGPHAAYIACHTAAVRQLPGRVVGVSVDADGNPALRLTLQTREQHIRRERATSNICTAQSLVAVMAAMYAVWHGPEGLRAIARRIHDEACDLAGALVAGGFQVVHASFFDTLLVRAPGRAEAIWRAAHEAGVQLRLAGPDEIGIAVGEDATPADLAVVRAAFGVAPTAKPWGTMAAEPRTSAYLTHPVFHAYRSETELMRYLHTLARRDFALDQGMIPLGSCTMKLTSAALMDAITLPGFADLHPFAPAEDAAGYAELIDTLESWLTLITGYDAVSFQPNAGSQGELAGLLAIRAYHEHRGEGKRDVCLIPASAHGTNAASAAMAGLRVVVVGVAADGSIDLDDLAQKTAQYADEVAVVMVTYPSTHGVFEETMPTVAELAHGVGAQVYVDGANMNALAGLAKPGEFGADCGHLNLHKTFAMPHGGGGPGVGPIAARVHLVPFLPRTDPAGDGDMVAGAPHGSAGLLPISYAYIALMGADGLRRASQCAVLAANHIARRLHGAFPVLYTGRGGLVAHECVLDVRPVAGPAHLSVDDVAKRLIDYGFHAPTMSFPVPGTLMVEPTESEDLGELDRFCDAMLAIRAEIDQVVAGVWPVDDNPLVGAPHPLTRVTADGWTHPYPRTLAAYPDGCRVGPVAGGGADKYWPPVGRVDNAAGDRNPVLRLAG